MKKKMFWLLFLFLIKVMSKFFLNDLLTIILRAPINMKHKNIIDK